MFYDIANWGKYHKTFCPQFTNFVMCYIVSLWQAFPALSNKRSSLVQKFVNY